MPEPSVSIVLTTLGRAGLLETVLRPLLDDADRCASEVVVVVDGPDAPSEEVLTRLAAADARLVPLFGPHRGKEGARQAGLDFATGDLVLFLDDDVRAEPGLACRHRDQHLAAGSRRVVVVGYMPVALPTDRRPDGATLLYADEYERECEGYERDPTTILTDLWGGNLSLRREDALAVGLVSDSFSQRYHQDRDFGLRCRAAGLEGVFARDCRAGHLHARTARQFRRDAFNAGAGQAEIHRRHPELAPLPDDRCYADLPRPAQVVVRVARRPGPARVIADALAALADAGARLRVRRLELTALRLLRRVELQRGARAYLTR